MNKFSNLITKRLKIGLAYTLYFSTFLVTSAQAMESTEYSTFTRYNLVGQVTGVINIDPDYYGPLQYTATRNTYNDLGLLLKTESGVLSNWQADSVNPEDWLGFTVSTTLWFEYNDRGHIIREYTKDGSTVVTATEYSYDNYDRIDCKAIRMTPSTNARDACTQTSFGVNGPDRITQYTYNDFDQILTEKRAVGTELEQTYVTNTYDVYGRLETITDANNNTTKLTYNTQNRLKRKYFPSIGKGSGYHSQDDFEGYTYDSNGNKTSLRKRDGKTIWYKYDNLNRITKKDLPNTTAKDVYYGYNLLNWQLYARFGSHEGQGVTREYDGFGYLVKEINNTSGTSRQISYLYDDNGNRTRVTHPDGIYFTYHYDRLDRLNYIKENGSTVLTTEVFDNFGRFESLTTTGNVSTTLGYDALSRVDNIDYQLTGYVYDLKVGFTYNTANQITSKGLNNERYHILRRITDNHSYQVNGLNQYTCIDGSYLTCNGGIAFGHDDNGNMTLNGGTSYTYDDENRLHTVSRSYYVNATLEYDPLGRLHTFTNNGVTTEFLYDGDALIGEYQAGNLQQRYVHAIGNDKPLVKYNGSAVSSTNRQFLHNDHQGSVIAKTDNSGHLVNINSYDSYGVPGPNNTGRFGYTGQIYLPEIELYHYKARVYHPKLGRFLQTDPVGYEDQMNMYAYVHNDPVNMVDPTGMISEETLMKSMQNAAKVMNETESGSLKVEASIEVGVSLGTDEMGGMGVEASATAGSISFDSNKGVEVKGPNAKLAVKVAGVDIEQTYIDTPADATPSFNSQDAQTDSTVLKKGIKKGITAGIGKNGRLAVSAKACYAKSICGGVEAKAGSAANYGASRYLNDNRKSMKF